jgi:hypothetical protein
MLLKSTIATHPCGFDTPWDLLLYSDEVVPGNQLSFNNLRKVWVLYFSFKQFGPAILSMEDAWFCVLAVRSHTVKQYSGGIAQVFGAIIRCMFTGAHSLQHSGILLDFADGTSVRLFSKLGMILQDGGAHKAVYMVKGDGGHKFCMCCRNLYSVASDIADENGENILTCSLVYEADLDFATDADVRDTVRRLAAFEAVLSPDDFKLREQAAGFNHHRHNMILDPALDNILQPISQFAHDWMHTMVVHGVWNTVILLLVDAIIFDGKVPDANIQLATYVELWTLPMRMGTSPAHLSDCFSKARWKSSRKAKYFKCTASDAISLYPIVACYVQAVFLRAGRCVNECRAYLLLAELMDLLVVSPHGTVDDDLLRSTSNRFLHACVDAGWRARMHPKFHWVVHLACEIRNFGMLLTCWVHERKHKMVKRYSDQVRNTKIFEKSILSEVICHHLSELERESKFDLRPGLVEPTRKAPRKLVNFLRSILDLPHDGIEYKTSSKARVSKFEVCHRRDVALLRTLAPAQFTCCEIWSFAQCNDEPMAIVSIWPLSAVNGAQGTVDVVVTDENVRLVPITDIVVSCTYRRKANGLAQIIIPCMYRDKIV